MSEPSHPIRGILDVREGSAYIRTNGYLAGPNDVQVSHRLIQQYDLRSGDEITGTTTGKHLDRLDTVNGLDPAERGKRPKFADLVPLHPTERLLLETTSTNLTTRAIDLVMPIGKGQRALIVSPPKAGKTSVLKEIANAVAANHPDCHLMVLLVDERPEEVTDIQRSVRGEVIHSTFDRPPREHVAIAELAIERAKRIVESGQDVVLFLDSLTRLGRAYNQATRGSGRILSGGVDAATLHPLKKILGAARNIEDGGSLTIVATAMVENGSLADTVLFEELKSTGNAELKLDRKTAERRVFPAIDISASGTRREELLLAPDELPIIAGLRRVLDTGDSQHAIDQLLELLRKTRGNTEFLLATASRTMPRAA